MTGSAPNWVKARANCTPADRMNDLISQIKHDIACFTKPGIEKRGTRRFNGSLTDSTFTVRRQNEVQNHRGTHHVDDSSEPVTVRLDGDAILACRNGKVHIQIVPQWNSANQSCNFVVDGEVLPVWQISEMILGDYMFEDLPSDTPS